MMSKLLRLNFKQPTSELIRISDLPDYLITESNHAAQDLIDQITNAILQARITPRTLDGFPITVADCIEKTKSAKTIDTRIYTYLGLPPFEGLHSSPHQYLKQRYTDERLKKKFADGLAKHEYITQESLVALLQSVGLDCNFQHPTGLTTPTEKQPASTSVVLTKKIITNNTKQRRNALDPILDEAIRDKGYDTSAIWSLLQTWAKDQRVPLIGLDESGGIKFMSTNYGETLEPDVLSRKALDGRLSRRKRAANAL